MIPYKWPVATAIPQNPAVRRDIVKAMRALLEDGDEQLRQRRAEIASIKQGLAEIAHDLDALCREAPALISSELRKYRYDSDEPSDPGYRDDKQRTRSGKTAFLKASPDDPEHPGWPAGTPEGRGGKFRPKDGNGSATGTTITAGVQYASGLFPPAPPDYDPNTWKRGQWPNGRYWLEDPDGNKYTIHPEDDGHWRHWDKSDSDGNDQGQWPPTYKKPWPGQKKDLEPDQSSSDPSGDTAPWNPSPFTPVVPVDPSPIPDLPMLPPVFVPE